METRRGWTGTPPGGHPPSPRVAGLAGLLGLTLSVGSALLALLCASRASNLLTDSAAGVTTTAIGLETLAAAAAALVAGWLALLLLAGAAEAVRGGAPAPVLSLCGRMAPGLAPRIAAGLIGSVALIGSAGAAQAQAPDATATVAHAGTGEPAAPESAPGPGVGPVAGAEPVPTEASVDGARPTPEPGWRPTSLPTQAPADTTVIELVSRGTAPPDAVVVRAGDTLWDLAARHLGPEADAAAVATAWPRWHQANREVIGADPHLLLPGTVLVPPSPVDLTSEAAS